ncbi:MAG: T9SS type A sorting domain-containing protein [Haliscomenobacter sp.]|nr:T9SS type A sorting domain-containing protein [Haliscomenobacter sp.]
MELVDIEYAVSKAENFGVFAREGMVTTSWNASPGVLSKGGQEALFTLVVKAKADVASLSEVLNLNSRITRAEAYRTGGDYLSVGLAIQPLHHLTTQPLGFALNQNTPNPFSGETVIGFTLPVAGEATLTIQDVTGRTLRVVKGQFAQGYNQVTVKASELNTTGVLSYTLKAGDYAATKKMIVLE